MYSLLCFKTAERYLFSFLFMTMKPFSKTNYMLFVTSGNMFTNIYYTIGCKELNDWLATLKQKKKNILSILVEYALLLFEQNLISFA